MDIALQMYGLLFSIRTVLYLVIYEVGPQGRSVWLWPQRFCPFYLAYLANELCLTMSIGLQAQMLVGLKNVLDYLFLTKANHLHPHSKHKSCQYCLIHVWKHQSLVCLCSSHRNVFNLSKQVLHLHMKK